RATRRCSSASWSAAGSTTSSGRSNCCSGLGSTSSNAPRSRADRGGSPHDRRPGELRNDVRPLFGAWIAPCAVRARGDDVTYVDVQRRCFVGQLGELSRTRERRRVAEEIGEGDDREDAAAALRACGDGRTFEPAGERQEIARFGDVERQL